MRSRTNRFILNWIYLLAFSNKRWISITVRYVALIKNVEGSRSQPMRMNYLCISHWFAYSWSGLSSALFFVCRSRCTPIKQSITAVNKREVIAFVVSMHAESVYMLYYTYLTTFKWKKKNANPSVVITISPSNWEIDRKSINQWETHTHWCIRGVYLYRTCMNIHIDVMCFFRSHRKCVLSVIINLSQHPWIQYYLDTLGLREMVHKTVHPWKIRNTGHIIIIIKSLNKFPFIFNYWNCRILAREIKCFYRFAQKLSTRDTIFRVYLKQGTVCFSLYCHFILIKYMFSLIISSLFHFEFNHNYYKFPIWLWVPIWRPNTIFLLIGFHPCSSTRPPYSSLSLYLSLDMFHTFSPLYPSTHCSVHLFGHTVSSNEYYFHICILQWVIMS